MKNSKVILGTITVGVLIGLGMLFISEKRAPESDLQQEVQIKQEDLVNLDLGEVLVKLTSDHSYMKSTISVGYNEKTKDVESKVPIMRDIIISYLMSKSIEDFGVDNLNNIKEDIKTKINEELQADIVEKVYFTSLVIQ